MKKILLIGALLITLVVAIAFALSWSFYREALQTIENSVKNEMMIIASQTATSIEELIDDYKNELSWMADTIAFDKKDQEEKTKFLLVELKDKRFAHLLFTLDAQGICDVIVPSGVLDGELHKDFSYRDYFQQARDTGEVAVSGLLVEGEAEQGSGEYNSFIIAAPIIDEAGSFKGVVGTDFRIQDISERFINPLTIRDNGYAWMLDSSGVTLAHHDVEKIGINLAASQMIPELSRHIREHLILGESGFVTYEYQGRKLSAYAPVKVGSSFWQVVLTVPYGDIEALVYPIFQRLMLVMCFVVLVITSGGFFVIRKHMEVKRLQEKVVALEIQIDEEKKAQEVSQITESDYFQELLEKADELRGE